MKQAPLVEATMSVRAILTDIEGTTSSIAFVKDVLFPYARDALPAFVAMHAAEPDVRRRLDAVATDNGGLCDDRMVVEVLQGWIDEDRKHTALKALQGMIWADGYRAAAFTTPIYPDAVRALVRWQQAGLPLYVYSSGSVAAQRLFFAHSDAGDLTSWFAGWFDTEIGGKRESASYRHIAASIGIPASQILFLSDVVPELDAARDAGSRTALVDRREDYAQPRVGEVTHGHTRVESFTELEL
jgi:enolase-phosphatase E1